uniref:Uncharacterized protein n=1 Tax=Oryza nivara TaxID=4536 RepID=A0A0E0I0B8_ORYNI
MTKKKKQSLARLPTAPLQFAFLGVGVGGAEYEGRLLRRHPPFYLSAPCPPPCESFHGGGVLDNDGFDGSGGGGAKLFTTTHIRGMPRAAQKREKGRPLLPSPDSHGREATTTTIAF